MITDLDMRFDEFREANEWKMKKNKKYIDMDEDNNYRAWKSIRKPMPKPSRVITPKSVYKRDRKSWKQYLENDETNNNE